uniref:Glycoprotein hormones alpha chain n=1 Tax=Takifugu rubripes TaxID=31033 RepID=A0A674PQM3_TAKRU
MSPSTISHLCLLALPVMSLLLLFSPIGRSHDSRSLAPGCHLHRKCRRPSGPSGAAVNHAAVLGRRPFPATRGRFIAQEITLSLHPPAFNVTIRSDRRGTCKGTHLVFACVGYCESSAFPSRYSVLVASNFTHNITSASRCCTISRDAKVKVRLDCPRGRHHDEIEILTAKACRCDMCRRSRY